MLEIIFVARERKENKNFKKNKILNLIILFFHLYNSFVHLK
jgi:hypothetical protein